MIVRDSNGRFIKGSHIDTEFKKGHNTWNKGTHIQTNTGRTHFKEGHKTWCDGLTKETDDRLKSISEDRFGEGNPNYKNGSTIDNGYKKILIDSKYIYEHRYIWEQECGEIPEGHVIHHINRNTLDNRIENLSCLSRSEHIEVHNKEGW